MVVWQSTKSCHGGGIEGGIANCKHSGKIHSCHDSPKAFMIEKMLCCSGLSAQYGAYSLITPRKFVFLKAYQREQP